jgi:plastocyanin
VKLLAPLLAAACLTAFSSSTAFAANTTVQVGPNGTLTFSPANITINVGDTVTWVVEANTHTTTSDSNQSEEVWDSGHITSASGPFTHTFTHAGNFTYHCSIHVNFGMVGSVTVNGVTPSGLSTIALGNSTIIAGFGTNATVTLAAPAPKGGSLIALASSDRRVTLAKPSVTIPAGNTSASVTLKTTAAIVAYDANITATFNGTTKTATLTVNPPAGLSNLALVTDNVIGGASVNATVTLGSVSSAKTVVKLISSDPSASVPASLTIAAGKTSGIFTIKTKAVATETMPDITASSAGVSLPAMLMVNPIEIESVSVNPSIVLGGNTSNGTVTLLAPPPATTVIMLTSGNTTAAKVPRSVTIAKGNTTGVFKVTTSKVKSTEAVQIDATLKNSTENTTLNVNGPLPPVVSGFGDSN